MTYTRLQRAVSTLITTVLLFALTGCATPYQRAGLTDNYGYSVQRISNDTYRAVFQANSSTSPQRIQDFTYLAAAQVAIRHNFRYFEILNTSNESFTTYIPPQSYFEFSSGYGYYHDRYGRHHHDDAAGHWVVRPGRTFVNPGLGLLIKCLVKKSDADKHSAGVYDALSLQKSIIEKYNTKYGTNIIPVKPSESFKEEKSK